MQSKNTSTHTSHSSLQKKNKIKYCNQNDSDSRWAPIPTLNTEIQTNRIPGVQSDSSEPEGTKTFTWSLSSPRRQQIKQTPPNVPILPHPKLSHTISVELMQKRGVSLRTYVVTGTPFLSGCVLASPLDWTHCSQRTGTVWIVHVLKCIRNA